MVMDNLKRKFFEPNFFCETVLPVCAANTYDVQTIEAYEKRIMADKPEFLKDNDYINKLYEEIEEDKKEGRERETMLMYHFSDLHWNMNYMEGTDNDCGAIVCCTPIVGFPEDKSRQAGKWGDYNCDANPKTFEQIKYTVEKTGQPDFILWTGDNVDHAISKDPHVTTNATVQITHFVEAHAPDAVVFPIHGNHEFDPMNTQDFDLAKDPVIDLIGEVWNHWMTPEVNKEYIENSYFSYDAVTHPDTTPKFKRKMEKTRIIALNTQNCYFYNFFLFGQMNDPGQELDWLENLLREMEKNGEVGIIIGHMSSGVADCLTNVSGRLKILLDRFQHIVRLSLYGHTHDEEFEVIRSVGDNKPIGVNHIAPSITTFTGRNPSFRAITLDVKTKLPVKIETYTLDIVKANKDDQFAEFTLHHELSEDYGIPDLSPKSMFDVTTRFKTDEKLALKYKYNMSAGGRNSKAVLEKGCDEKCRRMLSCHTSNAAFVDARQCMATFDFDWKVIQSYVFDIVYGAWVNKK